MQAMTAEGTSRFIFARAPYTSAGKTSTAQAAPSPEKYDAAKWPSQA